MKSIRPILLFVASMPLLSFSYSSHAELSYTGQLQQELVSWDGPSQTTDEYKILDGGEYQLNSRDAEGASYIALLSTFHLTPNHEGLAKFHFDLSQTDGLEQHEAYIGIQGPTSNWHIGTISSPYKSSTANWDPFLATFMQARGNGGMSTQHNGYVKSAINYQSNWWSTDIGIQWSPDNGSSISLVHSLTKWDFALAHISDQSSTVENKASKFGVRYRSGGWATALQYEMLDNNAIPVKVGYFSLAKQTGETEYSLGLGMYNSDNPADLDLNYLALGMKYAIAKNNIIHFGYRTSSVSGNSSLNESAFGLGFRYSF